MSKKPKFEYPTEDHQFEVSDEVYLIDNNKVDIFKAKIAEVAKKGFVVTLSEPGDNSTKKVLTPKRLLLPTPTNNAIYEEQAKKRENKEKESQAEPQKDEATDNKEESITKNNGENQIEPITDQPKETTENPAGHDAEPKNEEEEKPKPKRSPRRSKNEEPAEDKKQKENHNKNVNNNKNDDNNKNENEGDDDELENNGENKNSSNSNSPRRQRRVKVKKPVFDKQLIVKNAWKNGIHDVSRFQKYVKKSMKSLVGEFEKYFQMMNVNETPLFGFGGELDESEAKKFWTGARNTWKKLFDDSLSVDTDDFIWKAAASFKLQNQTESNAREALRFFFDPETIDEVSFVQFSAFLALFGPTSTMFRKIQHFLRCPPKLKDGLVYADAIDVQEPDKETWMNEFSLTCNEEEVFIYNNPNATTSEMYLTDEEGNKYGSWMEFFSKYEDNGEEQVANPIDEATTAIPIEAQ
ncbi:hypothetical protein TRFO_28491 [Tritrichomonas foetus]|uniref:Initiator binding protein 39kDa C-terminal domain-containing protein n=1 Tax=Tritrichomonas foetus TaxID=1144522 RepID=A0A1J4JY24_9EUKA|nr:hypothetical protein TRFO_28491 [Tritrichomonas foetus]|eukprot:OHT04057.1 hypothetical protein TRFO_28491 [Tritrichomonas foetus]